MSSSSENLVSSTYRVVNDFMTCRQFEKHKFTSYIRTNAIIVSSKIVDFNNRSIYSSAKVNSTCAQEPKIVY